MTQKQSDSRELVKKNKEIERLEKVIKDKEDTIATQKLLIDQLMSKGRN